MRFRPKNYKEEHPELFKKLIKNNPYVAQIHNFPKILFPYPSIENLKNNINSKYNVIKKKIYQLRFILKSVVDLVVI